MTQLPPGDAFHAAGHKTHSDLYAPVLAALPTVTGVTDRASFALRFLEITINPEHWVQSIDFAVSAFALMGSEHVRGVNHAYDTGRGSSIIATHDQNYALRAADILIRTAPSTAILNAKADDILGMVVDAEKAVQARRLIENRLSVAENHDFRAA